MAIYKDLNLTLKKHPGTGDILKLNDVDAVKQSIKTILFSAPFDSPFDPNFGGSVRNFLFELATPSLYAVAKRQIKLALEGYEPRLMLEELYVGDAADGAALNVGIRFFVTGNAAVQTANYSVRRI